jgi:hypothetical protein
MAEISNSIHEQSAGHRLVCNSEERLISVWGKKKEALRKGMRKQETKGGQESNKADPQRWCLGIDSGHGHWHD